jgi:hypothetical protein
METTPIHEKTAGDGRFRPAEALAAVQDGFFAHLSSLPLPRVADPVSLPTRIRARIGQLERRTAHLVANELDSGNVGFTLLAAAAYQVLVPELGREEASKVVDACLNQPLRPWVLAGARKMLDESPDPFATLVAASREREAHYFGSSFQFERPVDDGHGYVLHIRRCLFHEALRACGSPELQPVLCRFDLNWSDAVDPARHHLRFVRPSTFATADLCRMWFMRLEQDSGGP